MQTNRIVIVLGASNKPERYSYKAVNLLKEAGFNVIPVNPSGVNICGLETKTGLDKIKDKKIDTLTIYVNPALVSQQIDNIIALSPRRIIMNPGTENIELERIAVKNNIKVEYGCTLIMLKTNTFLEN